MGMCTGPDLSSALRQSGFSLLEILVAFSIMAASLAALYQLAGGSVRGFSEAERNLKAVLMAESLLALYDVVPTDGLQLSGAPENGFGWQITSLPEDVQMENPAWDLHRIEVEVFWEEQGRLRRIRLASLRPVDVLSR